MKRTIFIHRGAWAMLMATTMLVGFTACSDEDQPGGTTERQQAMEIIGMWQGSYPQTGTIVKDGIKHHVVKGVQAMTFNDDGTGSTYTITAHLKKVE